MQHNGIPFIQPSVCPGSEAHYVLGETADAKVYKQSSVNVRDNTNKTRFSVCCKGKWQDKLEAS